MSLILSNTQLERLKSTRAATMVEYALIVLLVALALIAVVRLISNEVSETFSTAADGFRD